MQDEAAYAAIGKSDGSGGADAARRTCDERCFPFEFLVHALEYKRELSSRTVWSPRARMPAA